MELEGRSLSFLAPLFAQGDGGDMAWCSQLGPRCGTSVEESAGPGPAREGGRDMGWLLSSSASQLLPHATARAVSITSSLTCLRGMGPGTTTDLVLSQLIPTVSAGPSHA